MRGDNPSGKLKFFHYLSLYEVEDKHVESAYYLISILLTLGLHTMDAMHLAIAQQHHGFERIAIADKLLAKAAETSGFKADVFD